MPVSPSGRIVLFGATGYTGRLTAAALTARGARPVLAARDAAAVRDLAEELGGLEWATADVGRPGTVRALVERGDVLASCVGPFTRVGDAAVEAALDAGAHYLDTTGEGPFIRTVFERHGPRAAAAGVALLPAMGYDFLPGNLAGALALARAGDGARRVDVGYFVRGAGPGDLSAGTRASAARMVLEPSFGFHDGQVVEERLARHARTFTLGGRRRPASSLGATEQFALPAVHPGLREVGAYLGWFGPLTPLVQAQSAALELARVVPGVAQALDAVAERLASGASGGPGPEARARVRSLVVGVAGDGAARRVQVVLEGPEPYGLTAALVAWAAERLAGEGPAAAGALGPVEAFGLDVLVAGAQEVGLVEAPAGAA